MAITQINENKIQDMNTLSNEVEFKTATVADGFKIPFMGKDYKTVILIKGGAADGNITFLMGNSVQAVKDLVIAVPKTKTFAITLESGPFKLVNGANKGYVMAKTSATDISLAVFEIA